MTAIVLFNVAMLLLGAMVGTGILPEKFISAGVYWLHNTIGITAPLAQKVRMVALIWIGSTIVIVDGALFMLVFLTTRVM